MMLLLAGPMTLQAGFFSHVMSYFQKSAEAPPPKIKVLIEHDKPGVVLEVKGKYKIYNPHTNELISTRFVGKRKFIQAIHDGMKWGEEFPGVYQLLIVPDEATGISVVDGTEYRGAIYVYDIGGTISIVNQVYVEDYLSSVLANLPKGGYSEEVMAAIAITARTMAYYYSEHPKNQYWGVDGQNPPYQGYIAANKNSPMDSVVKKTRNMVMSKTGENGASENQIAPFPAQWKEGGEKTDGSKLVMSQISLAEAQEMSKKGDHAAQILAKAFPGTRIELMHYIQEPSDSK